MFTGVRPGEKLSEDLWDEGVSLRVTEHPDIFRVENQEVLEGEMLYQIITELVKLAREGDREKIMALLDEVIPGSAIRSTPPPELTSVV